MSHNDHEPMPVRPAGGRSIWDMVIEDMRGRDEFGYRKYGGPLVAHDGRRSLVDGYQEALDLSVYLKKAIVEAESERERCIRIVAEFDDFQYEANSVDPYGPDLVSESKTRAALVAALRAGS